MLKINMKAWSRQIMDSSTRLAIPIMTHPGIDIIGKKVIDAVKDGKIHAEAVIALSKKYPADASTVIMDLTVEAEAFGATMSFSDDEVPSVTGRLVHDFESVKALEVPSLDAARVSQYLLANKLIAESLDKPVFGGCIGPYSLSGRLFDMTEIMMAIYTEPETAILLLEKCTAFITKYIKGIKASGANGVIIAEPAAGLLSNEDATTYSTAYIQRIVEEVQDDHFMVILHNCGNTGHCTASMTQSGAGGVHFGNKIDMMAAIKESPSDLLVMGNLDPVSIFKQASAAEVATATRELLDKTKAYQNFVISSGCDTPPGVPFENIEAFYREVAEYNKKQK